MLRLKKVAVTGGISSGKSLICQYFSEFGAYVIDADKIVHQLLNPDTEIGQKVVALLGERILDKQTISRSRVAKLVFLNPRLLKSLENLLHPLVYEEINRIYKKVAHEKNPPPLFVAEVPLLFESGGEAYFDQTIAVVSIQEKCWERYRASTGNEREDFNRRTACQLPQHVKAEKADIVIHNEGSIESLKKQTKTIYESLRQCT
ncbi:Dephospho-CoA kinase [Waddlia chondrophila 2032/99]|uniref:Dephospho-CoA kinase n=2 Tax=Waddlia chondrophila TaxID=71667 RepID=D6YSE6_WADCW|nr:dephospho-CoA kinase [Waddlia chondrophila]ADI38991.1 Dephospho-CoA kinase [Waddlia chondrophila WSU 86-1044]CCB92112.1 Dephospho-CoA kinase [Waddlia chondrophila 2032/99]